MPHGHVLPMHCWFLTSFPILHTHTAFLARLCYLYLQQFVALSASCRVPSPLLPRSCATLNMGFNIFMGCQKRSHTCSTAACPGCGDTISNNHAAIKLPFYDCTQLNTALPAPFSSTICCLAYCTLLVRHFPPPAISSYTYPRCPHRLLSLPAWAAAHTMRHLSTRTAAGARISYASYALRAGSTLLEHLDDWHAAPYSCARHIRYLPLHHNTHTLSYLVPPRAHLIAFPAFWRHTHCRLPRLFSLR